MTAADTWKALQMPVDVQDDCEFCVHDNNLSGEYPCDKCDLREYGMSFWEWNGEK